MRSLTPHRQATATRTVAIVAALALAVPLAGCGPRTNRQDTNATTGSSSQSPAAPGGTTAAPPDPAAVEGALDQVDQALKDVDSAMTAADSPAPDAD